MNNFSLKVKKLAAITASTVCGTAVLAALPTQVSAATFWDYESEVTNLTWTIETEGDEIPIGEGAENEILSMTVKGDLKGVDVEETLRQDGDAMLEYQWESGKWEYRYIGPGFVEFYGRKSEGWVSSGYVDGFAWGWMGVDMGDGIVALGYRVFDTRGWDRMNPGFIGYIENTEEVDSSVFKKRNSVTQVPEPTAIAALSLLGLGAVATRRQRPTRRS